MEDARSNIGLTKKKKLKKTHHAQIKGGQECHLEFTIEKLTKLCGTNWACRESDKKLLVAF